MLMRNSASKAQSRTMMTMPTVYPLENIRRIWPKVSMKGTVSYTHLDVYKRQVWW